MSNGNLSRFDPKTLIDRIMKLVKRNDATGCWEWIGYAAPPPRRYGRLKVGNRSWEVHRLMYLLSVGEIADGLCVCHRCDNSICVNPEHFFLGTRRDNNADCKAKGRLATGGRSSSRLHPERRPRGERHPFAKLTAADVVGIRTAVAAGESQRSVSRRYAVHNSTISAIITGKKWKPLPDGKPS